MALALLRAQGGRHAQMPRCVLVPSFVPLPTSARLRADAREGRDGTIARTITKGHHRNYDRDGRP